MLLGRLGDCGAILSGILPDIAKHVIHVVRTLKNYTEVIEQLPARRLVLTEFVGGRFGARLDCRFPS